jgi:hypothetical protein
LVRFARGHLHTVFSAKHADATLISLHTSWRRCERLRLVTVQVTLDRFDLFHAHLFQPHAGGSLGLLFHAAEYPARSPAFPYHLGYCQVNSTLAYEERSMDMRNIVFYRARLHMSANFATIVVKSSLSSVHDMQGFAVTLQLGCGWTLVMVVSKTFGSLRHMVTVSVGS